MRDDLAYTEQISTKKKLRVKKYYIHLKTKYDTWFISLTKLIADQKVTSTTN